MSIKMPPFDLNKISEKSKMSVEDLTTFVDLIQRSMEPSMQRLGVVEEDVLRYYAVERRGIGVLNTEYGKFWQYSFSIDDQWEKYSVIVKAEIDQQTFAPIFKEKERLVLRTDSGCETGQLFGDLTCDCGEQLHLAMKTIAEVGEGMIINIPHQDGRGMGLTFKLATLWI